VENLDFKDLAQALRHPSGPLGVQVAEKMNKDNFLINRLTIEHLDLSDNESILEIGMGNGFFVKHLFETKGSIHYTGCDFSETMVHEATKLNAVFVDNGLAEFVMSNAEALPFRNETFDKVFSVHTIYFWDNPTLVLNEIHRVLKTCGELTIAVRPKAFMEQYSYTEFGFSLYDRNGLVCLLSDNGFEVTKVIEKEEYFKSVNGDKLPVLALLVSAIRK
jgi:ubiquinone/menaquinone biosynthesis C-methylase UbiE